MPCQDVGVPIKGVGIPSQVERVPIQDMGVSFQGIGVFFQGVVVPFQVYLKNVLFFQWKSRDRNCSNNIMFYTYNILYMVTKVQLINKRIIWSKGNKNGKKHIFEYKFVCVNPKF